MTIKYVVNVIKNIQQLLNTFIKLVQIKMDLIVGVKIAINHIIKNILKNTTKKTKINY